MKKIDFKKELKHLYQPSAKEVERVEVPALNYLMVDGEGDPNTSSAYQAAVEALFAVSYAIKFTVKKGSLAVDYGVMPLEGLWWADDMSRFSAGDKSNWKWTMMIMQPEFITAGMVEEAAQEVRRKKKLSSLDEIRFEPLMEGMCAQILHLGPFTRGRLLSGYTNSLPTPVVSSPESITKSISATSGRPLRRNGKRSSANPCSSPCESCFRNWRCSKATASALLGSVSCASRVHRRHGPSTVAFRDDCAFVPGDETGRLVGWPADCFRAPDLGTQTGPSDGMTERRGGGPGSLGLVLRNQAARSTVLDVRSTR